MTGIAPLSAAEFESRVVRADGAVVLDFYQASCAPCRRLEPRLEQIARQYAERVVVYRVDVDRDMPLAERLGVQSLPTVLVLDRGREVERLDGLIRDEDLHRAFERARRAGGHTRGDEP